MSVKIKYELEYALNISTKVLYNRISTSGGLSEWFADTVSVKGNIFKFTWDSSSEEAKLISKKENKYAKFQWLYDLKSEYYFEFRITVEELIGDVALVITDFAEEEDVEDAKKLWDLNINDLKRTLGL